MTKMMAVTSADAALLREVADDYNERWCEMGGTSPENVAARKRIGMIESRLRALADEMTSNKCSCT
jgi:hypothetical protein